MNCKIIICYYNEQTEKLMGLLNFKLQTFWGWKFKKTTQLKVLVSDVTRPVLVNLAEDTNFTTFLSVFCFIFQANFITGY